ncbi:MULTISPECIES: hypothetical protein [unclassified Coleofasciculus]|uniref:hypothetical protein n=1 Tax=unclassified Coleofasciculus TaxID=2692782 RepID=UPI00187E9CE0|nr:MULTISPECIES: hypothetical protein [unclassified Coleofasciculus]MBE9126020.1 hypothetical protein [Coleofasciculus sp. LEGE 07081]MBE9149395.1 hypothetical protein [Coleofasciculus sp. LEGE 07092]
MLNQFRVRYPKGSLIGELVTIDRGQYIVRCLIQVEGTTLATALAAAETIELAEDKARNRALVALGIDPTAVNGSLKSSIAPQEVSVLPQPTPPVTTAFSPESLEPTPSHEVSSSPSTSSVTSTSKSESKRKKKTTPVVIPPEGDDEITVTEEFSVPEMKPLPEEVETPVMAETDLFEPTPDSIPAPSFSESKLDSDTSSQPTPENPVDFSEIIARTNVELKRLGWTQQQGRDYLVQTYGKRSRQLLTDEELLDFLHHLESEPTPDSD